MIRRMSTSLIPTVPQSLSPSSATLEELKDEIALLTNYSTDTIYRLRYATMHYDYISPSVERLLGYTADEIRAMNIRSLILETRIVTDTMRPVYSFHELEASRKRGEVSQWQADYRMKTRDGKEIWVADISYPWYDATGTIIGSVGSLRDITGRVEAEARVREEIERMANTDALTGLANRRAFFARVEDELKRLRRSHDESSLLLVDIDRFKKINAEHGQAAGDEVIRQVASIVQSCLRTTDIGARVGGEEFAALLPDTPAAGAYWVAERIRAAVQKNIFTDGEGKPYPFQCTVSIGIASAPAAEAADASSFYTIADTRLFIAKQTGRNQVSMDELVEG